MAAVIVTELVHRPSYLRSARSAFAQAVGAWSKRQVEPEQSLGPGRGGLNCFPDSAPLQNSNTEAVDRFDGSHIQFAVGAALL
jgi:hypothetical protein